MSFKVKIFGRILAERLVSVDAKFSNPRRGLPVFRTMFPRRAMRLAGCEILYQKFGRAGSSFRGWCFANGRRRRRTEAGARSRSFVFCALDSRQLSFIQPVYPRQLSLVAYKTPLTPAKNELLTRATSASIRRLFPSLSTPRKAFPPLGMGLADVTRRI